MRVLNKKAYNQREGGTKLTEKRETRRSDRWRTNRKDLKPPAKKDSGSGMETAAGRKGKVPMNLKEPREEKLRDQEEPLGLHEQTNDNTLKC